MTAYADALPLLLFLPVTLNILLPLLLFVVWSVYGLIRHLGQHFRGWLL